MIHLTPALLIAAASVFIGLGDATESDDPMVERFKRGVRAIRGRWDAAFVHHVGHWSHYDHRSETSSWPLPPANTAQAIAGFAREKNVLDARPEVGDLFLAWSPAKRRFAHTGIVAGVGGRGEYLNGRAWVECSVIAPNVYANGSIGGNKVLRMPRRFCPESGDAFIRWVELEEGRSGASASEPTADDGESLSEAA